MKTTEQCHVNIESTVGLNPPKSTGQTKSKKCKQPAISRSIVAPENESNPSEVPRPFSSEVADKTQIDVKPIAESEVYKIYCRNKDPKEAMKQIKKMKTCILFEKARYSVPDEEKLKSCYEEILKENIFPPGNSSREAKWTQIMKFLNWQISLPFKKVPIARKMNDGTVKDDHEKISSVIDNAYTRIEILFPNGLECWYIKDFERGIAVSKWYRGISFPRNWHTTCCLGYGQRMAMLNMMGITNSMIKSYYAESLKKKEFIKILWMDFAETIVYGKVKDFLPDYGFFEGVAGFSEIKESFEETETDTIIIVNATLQLYYYNEYLEVRRDYSIYRGKSTRQVKLTPRSKNEKEEMKNEAKKNAMKAFFKSHFGITEFNDISIDELQLIGCK